MEATESFLSEPGFAEPWELQEHSQDDIYFPDSAFLILDDLPPLEVDFPGEFPSLDNQVSSQSCQQPSSQVEIAKELEGLVIHSQQQSHQQFEEIVDESRPYSSSPSPPPVERVHQQDDLTTMLQRCIASHITTKGSRTATTTVKKKRVSGRSEHELVAGLQTAMMKRRQHRESPTAVAVSSAATHIRAGLSRDVMSMLHDCAYAVATRDVGAASDLAATIRSRHGASPVAGDARQRLAHYFIEALMARALGTGRELSEASSTAASEMDTIYSFRIQHTPSPLLPHFFSTQAILRAIHRATAIPSSAPRVLHIVDVGMARNRFQWSLLLHALALKPLPFSLIRITAFDAPQHATLLENLGKRILAQAAELGLGSVEYESAIFDVENWEKGILHVHGSLNDVVIVNALFSLDWLDDESAVSARNHRRGMLDAIAKLKPDVMILGINDGRLTSEMRFLDRFCQAVRRFGSKFDYAEECTSSWRADPGRLAYEGRFLAPEIVNLVACDGRDRFVRTAPYEEWSRAMDRCGFEMEAMDPTTFSRAKSMLSNFKRHFEVEQDQGWMKLSWKKITTQCVSSWIPKKSIWRTNA